jgi:hypothetical protein
MNWFWRLSQFTLRDLLWAVVAVAVLAAWYVDRRELAREREKASLPFYDVAHRILYRLDWEDIGVHRQGFWIDRRPTTHAPDIHELFLRRPKQRSRKDT